MFSLLLNFISGYFVVVFFNITFCVSTMMIIGFFLGWGLISLFLIYRSFLVLFLYSISTLLVFSNFQYVFFSLWTFLISIALSYSVLSFLSMICQLFSLSLPLMFYILSMLHHRFYFSLFSPTVFPLFTLSAFFSINSIDILP